MANADRIIELLHEAKARSAGAERDRFLADACRDDAGLEEQISSLLQADAADSGSFLRKPLFDPQTAFVTVKADGQSLRCFGDYELREEIARGGMGVVFKARQRKLDRIVAVKVILAGEFASREQALRFRAEAEAAARLQHPNIVSIHETGEQDGQPYFSMEYVEGGNLATLVCEKPLPAKRAADYVKTIAGAIHYAHEQGILHRDLKPSNILIDAADQPHITDFGLAKWMQRESFLTLTGEAMGSPSFMPPEQAGGKGVKAGRYSDVYGMGAILYFLLTGRPPFVAGSVAETMHHVLNSEVVSPRLLNPAVPPGLATICLTCLEKEPAKRYQTAQQLADELGRFLNDEPILAHPLSGTIFETTLWMNSEYSLGYLEQADEIIPERRYLFHLVGSFLRFVARGTLLRICDLGCGDGALAQQLAGLLPNAALTLVDGAPAMLNAAKARLKGVSSVRFVESTFDDISEGRVALGIQDVFVSCLAIHHLAPVERAALFFRLKEHLAPGGWLLNVDCAFPDESFFKDWQYELWREWILEVEKRRPRPDSLRDVPDEARRNPDNKLSRLAPQLNALRRAGFEDVDCLYRNGIFVVYGGRTPDTGAIQSGRNRRADSPPASGWPQTLRIGLIGDYHPEVTAHRAIIRSLELAVAEFRDWQLDIQWLPTDAREQFAPGHLSGFDGLWCVPASPYASMEGALRGIQFAREQAVPFLGTCAGFQHTLIEYARNVLGQAEADHEETRPEGQCLVISRLACPLVEKQGQLVVRKGTMLRRIYGRATGTETYHCSFGLSLEHEVMFEGGQFSVSARDSAGRAHAVELSEHPFFVATLFQPERSALQNQKHPVIRAFVRAALARACHERKSRRMEQEVG
ncbi:MAG TPA: protein kinase [Candidatus Dormibacteraeota bacterium]|nr:protein kinase [Candidatus Dormibacteraeota bacterium]